jgi:hypothetical protein
MNAAAPVIITRWEDAHLAKITVPQIQKSSKPDQSTTPLASRSNRDEKKAADVTRAIGAT